MTDFEDAWNNYALLLQDGGSLSDLRAIQERDQEQLKNVQSAREKWLTEKRSAEREERKDQLSNRIRTVGKKIQRLQLRVQAAHGIFEHLSSPKSEVSYPPPKWENLDDSDQQRASYRSTSTRYQETIRKLLEENSPGTFDSKTELYRKADDRLGNESGEACRRYLNQHMENEPQNEEEWRDYFDM